MGLKWRAIRCLPIGSGRTDNYADEERRSRESGFETRPFSRGNRRADSIQSKQKKREARQDPSAKLPPHAVRMLVLSGEQFYFGRVPVTTSPVARRAAWSRCSCFSVRSRCKGHDGRRGLPGAAFAHGGATAGKTEEARGAWPSPALKERRKRGRQRIARNQNRIALRPYWPSGQCGMSTGARRHG